ncbi:biosynthesis of aminoglycoside antibiotics (plasmid) [Geminocystis sp. NIES-3708]|uniref:ParB/RepB/Spo0J family partition protein n=1 Tax=Geminocystis sp. NIES-3708 TaxID=1615909 RepID=UPI0005FC74B7|nr:ParB/RepB/Spo0J family partition protein [Geminocystis sp. NIES-3708]BAQ63114.1 biosynthesis of aminoglycoside antibiotics [Geminocystis sp. NIES-3708]
MNQLELIVSFQDGDVVIFKNPDTEHQLGKKICEVMAVEGERVKLIEKGSSLNKPKHWIYAEIKNLELFSESKKLTKTSLEVKSDENVGHKNNNQSDFEKTSTPPSKDQEEISDSETNLDEKSPTNSNEESDSQPSVDAISEANFSDQSLNVDNNLEIKSSSDSIKADEHKQSLNVDNNSEIKSSSDSIKADEHKQSPLNYSSESDLNSSSNSMMKTTNDNPVKPLTENKSKDVIIQSVDISQIVDTPETQSRCKLDLETIEEYAELMESGVNFPPVILYFDGEKYYLADGFHRLEAAKKCNLLTINAEVRQGSKSDAILYSVSANANHGLRRTSADKTKAVETVLKNEEWRKWSDNEIAKQCGVSHPFVGKIRAKLYPNTKSKERTYTDKHGKITVMNTDNIGKKSKKSKKADNPENTVDNIPSSLLNTQSSSNNINPPYRNQPEIDETIHSANEQVTMVKNLIDDQSIDTFSLDASIINEGKKDNNDVNGTLCVRTRDNDETELSNNDTKNDQESDNRQYVQKLKESFTFVKSEILAIVSSDQEIQIIDALNLINGVLTNYLEKLS